MKLRIKTLTGQTLEVEVNQRDTILELKVCFKLSMNLVHVICHRQLEDSGLIVNKLIHVQVHKIFTKCQNSSLNFLWGI